MSFLDSSLRWNDKFVRGNLKELFYKHKHYCSIDILRRTHVMEVVTGEAVAGEQPAECIYTDMDGVMINSILVVGDPTMEGKVGLVWSKREIIMV